MIINDQAALDLAFELFMTLAPDNLSEAEMALFNQHFNEYGFIELFDFEETTLNNLDVSLDFESESEFESEGSIEKQNTLSASLVEVVVGATIPNIQTPLVFAKVILSIDSEKQFSHIQWMSDLN